MQAKLQGRWRVRRVSGLLPPGVTKEISGGQGRTLLFGIPMGRFDIENDRFVYRRWPIVDHVDSWHSWRPGVDLSRGRPRELKTGSAFSVLGVRPVNGIGAGPVPGDTEFFSPGDLSAAAVGLQARDSSCD